jgi:hypothetical protein
VFLKFIECNRHSFLPILDITGVDVVERSIDFRPQKGIAYDPRHLVAGTVNELDGTWISGFFDKVRGTDPGSVFCNRIGADGGGGAIVGGAVMEMEGWGPVGRGRAEGAFAGARYAFSVPSVHALGTRSLSCDCPEI